MTRVIYPGLYEHVWDTELDEWVPADRPLHDSGREPPRRDWPVEDYLRSVDRDWPVEPRPQNPEPSGPPDPKLHGSPVAAYDWPIDPGPQDPPDDSEPNIRKGDN